MIHMECIPSNPLFSTHLMHEMKLQVVMIQRERVMDQAVWIRDNGNSNSKKSSRISHKGAKDRTDDR